MKYVIHPYRGVGDIEFGMTPADVRSRMKSDFKLFKRTPEVVFPSDYFPSDGVFFNYDASGLLESIEFTKRARPTINGLDLFNLTFGQAVAKLAVLDKNVEEDGDSATAYHLGVGIWTPYLEEDRSAPIESIIAFRRGYYDQVLS